MIRQVLYVSAIAPGIEPGQVAEILGQSRRNNGRDGVSGLLLFTGESFLQILEGPAEALERTLARIAVDQRHSQLLVLLDHQVERRSFADWTMGYRAIRADYRCDGAVFTLTRDALAARVGPDDGVLRTLLQSFCDVELVDA